MNREEVRARTIRDLTWLVRLAEDYQRGLEGHPCQHSLQDIELVVKDMRDRFNALSALEADEMTEADFAKASPGPKPAKVAVGKQEKTP